jgi:hypothetical protein
MPTIEISNVIFAILVCLSLLVWLVVISAIAYHLGKRGGASHSELTYRNGHADGLARGKREGEASGYKRGWSEGLAHGTAQPRNERGRFVKRGQECPSTMRARGFDLAPHHDDYPERDKRRHAQT